MAWAALIPIADQLLKGDEKPAAPAQQLPPPPTMGEIFAANQASHNRPMPTTGSASPSNPFSQFPIGGGQKGPNG